MVRPPKIRCCKDIQRFFCTRSRKPKETSRNRCREQTPIRRPVQSSQRQKDIVWRTQEKCQRKQ
jgi:hypothetical protein